jgi:hypothetical protein
MSSNGLLNGLGRWFRFAIGILVRSIAQQLVEVLALDVRHDVFLSSAFREGLVL